MLLYFGYLLTLILLMVMNDNRRIYLFQNGLVTQILVALFEVERKPVFLKKIYFGSLTILTNKLVWK